MKSSMLGRSTSNAEVQDITKSGIWLFVKGKEYYLPYQQYPWFKDARVSEVYNLELHHNVHLHWPDLDIDLELQSLNHPDEYPLKYK